MMLVKLISTLLVLAVAQGEYTLYSPRITAWGRWSQFSLCPPGKYVNGMRLKVEPIRKPGLFGYTDNTALNAIELYCGEIGKSVHRNSTRIFTDAEGKYGDWGTQLYCPETTFATGFQLRSERSKGSNFFTWILGGNDYDDTAANNIRLFCSDKSNPIEGYGTSEGFWTSSQHCLERQAICGFRTQIEPYQDKGDDSGLNNVDFECCDIPNPAKDCVAQETWDVVKECDNTRGVTELSCTYQKKIGITNSKVATKADTESYNNLGFNTGTIGSMLVSNFGSRSGGKVSPVGSTVWSNFEVSNEETVHGLTFKVLPGYKSELLQVVGTCGIYSIRTPKFIRQDTNVLNETFINEVEANAVADNSLV